MYVLSSAYTLNTHSHSHIHIHTYTYTHTHTYIHYTYTHTHTHTHTFTCIECSVVLYIHQGSRIPSAPRHIIWRIATFPDDTKHHVENIPLSVPCLLSNALECAACCSVLQCVAVCCSVLKRVVVTAEPLNLRVPCLGSKAFKVGTRP